ncbi:proteasome ATPase [Bifidobacterium leontopitheci]|uniref:AAA ATPase forming ring-shaped complexes n=1 Tax=Bifidobacterium leontopitheci TaxID=2650774 RepID=A0A6I1GT88_9BIFI|nr:proteasome ATPase [Bifidobacterium leontopitheci]KAB7791398.1 aAA ATPase forming ring-shaped complex [Bifidobacterium leontopitheci]
MRQEDDAAIANERLAADNDRLMAKNHALAQALTRAGKELTKAKAQLAQMAAPPKTYATMVKVDSCITDELGVQHAGAEIISGGRRLIVPVAANVNAARLATGATVLLNENMTIVEQRGADTLGSVRTVRQVLDDGRLIVADQGGNVSVIRAGSAIARTMPSVSQRVLVDASGRIALETLPDENTADLVLEEVPDVTFADIGGLDDQIDRIRDAVQLPFLHRGLYERYDLKAPKGVLLYGPPGNGKTMIAKAVAHALSEGFGHGSGVFLSVKGPELLNKFVGESERLIRQIFKRARERAADGSPVIVFIDEMDSLLRTRGTGVSSDMETTIVPQFLAELDGVESLDNVMVIGASNRVDMIDPAVLRPGRLDVKIRVDRPGPAQATSIIRHYLTDDLPLQPGLDADDLARVLVRDIYTRSSRRHLCDVCDDQGQWSAIFLADVTSGAMLKNIVDRAKTKAVKASIISGARGGVVKDVAVKDVALDVDMLGEAVDDEFQETRGSVTDVDPVQWSRINGMDSGRVTRIRPVSRKERDKAAEAAARSRQGGIE